MLGGSGTSTAESSEAPLSDSEVGIVAYRPFSASGEETSGSGFGKS